jgi:inhibitor of cysteine peptidase
MISGLCGSCKKVKGPCGDVAEYVFGEKDNSASVQVQRDAKITIELNENPTTGYRWMISRIDEAFLVREGDTFLPPVQRTPGAGGLHRFFFRAKREGSTALTLINKRAWQRDEQAVGTFNLALRILS